MNHNVVAVRRRHYL